MLMANAAGSYPLSATLAEGSNPSLKVWACVMSTVFHQVKANGRDFLPHPQQHGLVDERRFHPVALLFEDPPQFEGAWGRLFGRRVFCLERLHQLGLDVRLRVVRLVHAAALGVEIAYGNVLSLTKDNGFFLIVTDSEQIEAKAVIVATGTLIRTLGVAGEKEFLGRGVSYCATCDGNFFKGKDVAVSGAKDQAVEEAIYLAGLVHRLYFLAPSEIDAPETHLKTLKAFKNVEIIDHALLKTIKGERTVSSIEVMVEGKVKEYLVSGVFPLSGERSSSDFLAGLKPDNRNGFLTVDLNMKTSISGLFAAGDIVDRSLRQIVTASSDGAVAATSSIAYVHALTK